MLETDINQAKTQLDALLQTALAGDDVIITKDGEPVLKLTRINQTPKRRQSGSARGQIVMAEDFDAPLDDFHEYMP